MRLKYKEIRNRIEDKILEQDGYFQTNRCSIVQLHFDFSDPRLPKSQKEVLQNSRFNEQTHSHLHQHKDQPKRVHFRDSSENKFSKRINRTIRDDQSNFQSSGNYPKFGNNRPAQRNRNEFSKRTSRLSRFLRKFVGGDEVSRNSTNSRLTGYSTGNLTKSNGQSFYWQRLRQRFEAERRKRTNYFTSLNSFDSGYMFKYSLPNSLDLVMKKYSR